MSKHQLLDTWPKPEIIRDIAKFVGFMHFYSRFIPNFEVRITPLWELLRKEYMLTIGKLWSKEAAAAWDNMRHAVLKDPCLRRYDHRKLLVLRTNFSAEGMGYVACQPADDEASQSAMHKCRQGGTFDFMTKDSTAQLHPVRLDAVAHAEMRNASTPILVKRLPVTSPSINADTCVSVNDLFG